MAYLAGLPSDFVVTSMQFTRTAHTAPYPAISPSHPSNSLAGLTAVLTGASRGIGARGIAPALVKAGVRAIVLVGRTGGESLRAVEAALRGINPKVETLCLGLDITSTTDVQKAWGVIGERFPSVEILVNNAGVDASDGSDKTHELDPDLFFRNFEVNVRGTHNMTHAFLRQALPTATPDHPARVVNLVSSSTWGVHPFLAGYAASKAALQHYTTTLAASYSSSSRDSSQPTVLAFAVNPGMVDTAILPPALRAAGFDTNDPALPGCFMVWLLADPKRSAFLSGRAVTAEWDVGELVGRREEIVQGDLLTLKLNAVLGVGQFGKE